jgi:POT family proton-dependent oligopeptide transporter
MITQHSRLRACIFWQLALIEFFERYGFYIVMALMILLLTNQMGLTDAHAYSYVAGVTALLYIAPLLGGWITDRYLDSSLALCIGSIFLCLGYLCLNFWAQLGINMGIGFLIIGMAFFKFSPSAMIGEMYRHDQKNLDRLFVIFYMSINVGGMLAFFSSGWLQETLGWYHIFLLPASFLLIATAIAGSILFYKKNMEQTKRQYSKTLIALLMLGCLLSVGILEIMLHFYNSISPLTVLITGTLIALIAKQSAKLESHEKNNLIFILIMCAIGVLFFVLYCEQYTLITLFAERLCKEKLLGLITIKPSAYTGFDGMWILLFGPFISFFFQKNDKKVSKQSLMRKFSVGLIIAGCGFYVLALTVSHAQGLHSVDPIWVCLSFAFQGFGEILVSALGLSLMAKWAPQSLYNALMGGWFLVIALGSCLSGYLNAHLASVKTGESLAHIISTYHQSFLFLTVMAIGAGLFVLLISRPVCRLLNN